MIIILDFWAGLSRIVVPVDVALYIVQQVGSDCGLQGSPVTIVVPVVAGIYCATD
jgi:hypothetical protein